MNSCNYIAAYLFPLGNWSWSINSRCLSDGRLSHRNLSKNFFLWESSLLLCEVGPALFMKLGSRPWNSNLALEPITWFGGKYWAQPRLRSKKLNFKKEENHNGVGKIGGEIVKRTIVRVSMLGWEIVGWQVTAQNKFWCNINFPFEPGDCNGLLGDCCLRWSPCHGSWLLGNLQRPRWLRDFITAVTGDSRLANLLKKR